MILTEGDKIYKSLGKFTALNVDELPRIIKTSINNIDEISTVIKFDGNFQYEAKVDNNFLLQCFNDFKIQECSLPEITQQFLNL